MEKIFSDIKSTASKIAKKSGELVELSKLKLSVASTKSDIELNFQKLGKLIYLSRKDDSEISHNDLDDIFTEIDNLYDKLAEQNDTIANLTNKKLCPECHSSNETDAQFCSRCGFQFAVE